MEKNYPLLFSILISFSSQGQNYLIYHDHINRAEYHLVNNQSDSSLYYYDKAFADYDFIFVKDAVIAAQFAWEQKNKEKTIQYLLKGAGSGLRSKCLNDIPVLNSFMNSRFYEQVYDSMAAANKYYENYFDKTLSDEWAQRGGELALANESERIDVIQKNVGRVKELIRSGKYPGEKYIGIDDCKTLNNLNALNSLANYDCIVTEMHDVLWNAVKKGELHPREFATLWEWEYVRSAHTLKVVTPQVNAAMRVQNIDVRTIDNPYTKNNPDCVAAKQKIKRFRLLLFLEDVPREEIDQNRAAYHICNSEIDDKKWQLQEKKGYRFFFGMK